MAALDTRIKAMVASTMYDMTRVNASGYFDFEDSADARYQKKKAHSCYFSRDAYAAMVKDNPYADNKELLIIPDAVHTGSV